MLRFAYPRAEGSKPKGVGWTVGRFLRRPYHNERPCKTRPSQVSGLSTVQPHEAVPCYCKHVQGECGQQGLSVIKIKENQVTTFGGGVGKIGKGHFEDAGFT